ncbi:hypothetical protein [Kribbella sp. NPDC003557]
MSRESVANSVQLPPLNNPNDRAAVATLEKRLLRGHLGEEA